MNIEKQTLDALAEIKADIIALPTFETRDKVAYPRLTAFYRFKRTLVEPIVQRFSDLGGRVDFMADGFNRATFAGVYSEHMSDCRSILNLIDKLEKSK